MLLTRVAFTSGLLLIAPAGFSYGADTPSIYNQLIAQAAAKPANWLELLDSGQAQAIAFYMIDGSGDLIRGPRIVSAGQPDALRKSLETMLRNAVIKAAPFKRAPNRKYSGQVLKVRFTTCNFEEDTDCKLSVSDRLPDDVRAWKKH